ncbi:MAG: hypothetical protein HKN35_10325 [Woeseia sp.]|nr:hypothetical protein [Woeseia sp.]
MHIRNTRISLPRRFSVREAVTASAALLLTFAHAASSQGVPPPPSSLEKKPATPTYPGDMPEELRAPIKKLAVISGRGPADQDVSGSYEKATAGLVGGMSEGNSRARISKEIGPVPVNIPIPILTLPATIIGGLAGSMQRQIQEFRDALTEEIVNAESPPLTDDGLALDVFWGVRELPSLDSKLLAAGAEMPEGTDAALYVSFGDIGIDVQGKEAIITTSAEATLRHAVTGQVIYESDFHYQDRDTLRNWTANDNAVWRAYGNFARYSLGREISAALFDRVSLPYDLSPVSTKTAKRDRKDKLQLNSKSLTPTLAWELTKEKGADLPAWAQSLDEKAITYDLEIYDGQRPVYTAEQLRDAQHTLTYELEPCQAYRWSVRPAYHVDGIIRYGEWMSFPPPPPAEPAEAVVINGPQGRSASTAPAFTQDYPVLDVACGRR